VSVEEAKLERRDTGLTPVTEGWFVVNVRDGAWVTHEDFGAAFVVEGEDARFPQLGAGLHVLWPGRPNGMYHSESEQEDFLVLAGECLLLVEGEERRLKAWDFVHCPPGTDHIFVGAGEGPCVIFMVGARREGASILYSRNELALRHGAGVEADTNEGDEAYARFPRWQPGPPESFAGMPWSE
jgi:uncharacterized cupin superfamily protein